LQKKHAEEIVLSLRNVSKTYLMGDTKVHALKNISLDVVEGESLIIRGPSGSGKSTMLHILGLLDRPTSGEVMIGKVNAALATDAELAKLRVQTIGFVFQFFFLVPTLNAVENVELPMIFNGLGEEERRERALKLLDRVGLANRVSHMPNELSGGQRQRVAIARALANDPKIILADEPTGNLDSKSGDDIMKLFHELHAHEKKTIITVTHDPARVTHADRVIHLKDGEIEKIEVLK
jgi:putative ABC transport system ATP-binding protein